jgi:transcriptional regulator with XRE-family HTH domain
LRAGIGPSWPETIKPDDALNRIDEYVGRRLRMRRLMLGMSRTRVADALGLTFQQLQKYEKGRDRIGAGRLQQISQILQVRVAFFFEGAPNPPGRQGAQIDASVPDYVSACFASSNGLRLAQAFMQISDPRIRRSIVDHVEHIAEYDCEPFTSSEGRTSAKKSERTDLSAAPQADLQKD